MIILLLDDHQKVLHLCKATILRTFFWFEKVLHLCPSLFGTPCAVGNRVEARHLRIAAAAVVNAPPATAVSAVAPAAEVAAARGTAQTSCCATPSLLPALPPGPQWSMACARAREGPEKSPQLPARR